MRIDGLSVWALAAMLGVALGGGALAGCSDSSGGGTGGSSDDGTDDDGTDDDGVTTGTGDATSSGTAGLEVPGGVGAAPKAAYPAGPYGIGINSVVPDFRFVGYTAPAADRADLEVVALSDFYNPTGTDLYPDDGRAWAGKPKPKAIAISVAAYWCAPCKQEWRVDVPEQQAELGPLGGEFLLLLSDGDAGGVPPVLSELNAWVSTFEVTAPSAMDPTLDFQTVWASDAFPQNVLVRTSDMRIIAKASGVPDDRYWNKMRAILEGTL